MNQHSETISILIGGAAGTGIMTLERVLTDAFKHLGYFVFSTKEYMSRVRGGSNTTLLRVSTLPIEAPCWEVDIFIALDKEALNHAQERFNASTLIMADEHIEDETFMIRPIPLLESTKKLGNSRYTNIYVCGLLFGMFSLEASMLSQSIETLFEKEKHKENLNAMHEGFAYAKSMPTVTMPEVSGDHVKRNANRHLLNGSTAAGFGFLLGGCNMIFSYPMSPSTGVLNFMAARSKAFEMVVEQSEDEIAALNMVLGAWYSGARAMTSTSGGGFALMSEAVSLSGVSETPCVVYLAQRPGPATGLPTRTEQGDLNLAIHSGHGFFGRIVLAPGDLHEALELAHLAFVLAEKFQMPVIYLSDQYLADSVSSMDGVDFEKFSQHDTPEKTSSTYRRYDVTKGCISPRGLPGLGEGLVVSSSHEHDQRGISTERYEVREEMQKKREEKIALSMQDALIPEVIGQGDIAIVGWGSTKAAIKEALRLLDNEKLFQVHFTWVYPLNPEHLKVLKDAKHLIVVENNSKGDFADILQYHGLEITHRILQSNGFAFFTDQLADHLMGVLKEIT